MSLTARSTAPLPDCPPQEATALSAAFDHVDTLRRDGFGGILRAPMIASPVLSASAGCDLWVKLENLQVTGSFKERGAFARMAALCRDRSYPKSCAYLGNMLLHGRGRGGGHLSPLTSHLSSLLSPPPPHQAATGT